MHETNVIRTRPLTPARVRVVDPGNFVRVVLKNCQHSRFFHAEVPFRVRVAVQHRDKRPAGKHKPAHLTWSSSVCFRDECAG